MIIYKEYKIHKKIYIYPNFLLFFVAKTENSGVGVIASYSVVFYIFIYFKTYFYPNTI